MCFKNIQLFYISKVGSGSIGTTTTGADVSPVIPALKWSSIIEDALNLTISDPDKTYPLFLIDSEGMGVRGDAFDFMTTSPPAIVAKVISKFRILISHELMEKFTAFYSLRLIWDLKFEYHYQVTGGT